MNNSIFYGKFYDLAFNGLNDNLKKFWVENSKDNILELGCGTGKITIPLANNGFEITALDNSEKMIKMGKKKIKNKQVKINWILADMRNFNIDKKFSTVIIPSNNLTHLINRNDIESCFNSIKQHLKKDGKLIIDIFNPNLDILTRDSNKRYLFAKFKDPETQKQIKVEENNVYDKKRQINNINYYYKLPNKDDEIKEKLSLRVYFPSEINNLLHYNGFVIKEKYGDYDKNNFKSSSAKQLIICTLKD
ncbi:MAG: class I SAM-dependent methyltransferase [bacterium]